MFSATNFDDFKNRFIVNPGGDEENKEEVKYLPIPKSQSSKATLAKSAQEAAA